ncbi:hypothetical protein FRB90_008360 [Tulasnella sp. 427]|nr:hypothetical protein FRB90_008360 [Tulasnella sp. 427]
MAPARTSGHPAHPTNSRGPQRRLEGHRRGILGITGHRRGILAKWHPHEQVVTPPTRRPPADANDASSAISEASYVSRTARARTSAHPAPPTTSRGHQRRLERHRRGVVGLEVSAKRHAHERALTPPNRRPPADANDASSATGEASKMAPARTSGHPAHPTNSRGPQRRLEGHRRGILGITQNGTRTNERSPRPPDDLPRTPTTPRPPSQRRRSKTAPTRPSVHSAPRRPPADANDASNAIGEASSHEHERAFAPPPRRPPAEANDASRVIGDAKTARARPSVDPTRRRPPKKANDASSAIAEASQISRQPGVDPTRRRPPKKVNDASNAISKAL